MSFRGERRVILIGIGGATCSGKTTLAKYLREILPGSFIVHQDDFAPPQELIPMHPLYNVQDWDSPQGCIEWGRMISFLSEVRKTGSIPPDHRSHDHLNEQKEVAVNRQTLDRWRAVFLEVQEEHKRRGEEVVWAMVDGFLLYWNIDVVKQLDVRVFLRVPYEVLKQRRLQRHGYHTAVQSNSEGALWRDPPNYWEQIVWPAYIAAHQDMMEDGDVEHGQPNERIEDLMVVEGLEVSMDDMIDRVCQNLAVLLLRPS